MFTPAVLSLKLMPVLLKKNMKKVKNIKTQPHSSGPFFKTVIETQKVFILLDGATKPKYM